MQKKNLLYYYRLYKSKKSIKPYSDEYIEWLSRANAGMLNPGNVYCFDYAIKNLPTNNTVIEIGSFCGLSTNVITHLMRKHGKQNTMITSDKWIFENSKKDEKIGSSQLEHNEYRTYVMESYKRNIQFFSRDNTPYTVEMISDDFFEKWEENFLDKDVLGREVKLGGKISFAYIDGNHTYDYVKRDFENVNKYLDVGGFILFDDSSDFTTHESSKLMKDVLQRKDYRLIIKNPNYLFQKI